MYRYHEIIVKKESDEKKLMSQRNDIVSRKYFDYFKEALRKVNNRYDGAEKKAHRDKKMDVYRTIKLIVNDDNTLNEDEKNKLTEHIEYEAAKYFNTEFIQYYIKLVKAFSVVSDESNHELEVNEGENEDRFVIREFLNFNSSSVSNISQIEGEIQNLGDYGLMPEEKIKEHKDVFGDKITYKNIFATSLTNNDSECEYDGDIEFLHENCENSCFTFGYKDYWREEGFQRNAVNPADISDKSWRVCTTNIILFPFLSPDESEWAEYEENPQIKKHADHFIYDDYTTTIGDYNGSTYESYYYIEKPEMKTFEIVELAEAVLDTFKSYYAANKNLLNKYELNSDMANGINYFKMIFFTDDFEVLYVYGNAETNELKYGYKKF